MSRLHKVLNRVREDGILKTGSIYFGLMSGVIRRSVSEIGLENKRDTYGYELSKSWPSSKYREQTLSFIESMRMNNGPYGRYRYSAISNKPTLYASTYAALTRHLHGDLQEINDDLKEEWIEYLLSHQSDDGLFRDTTVANEIAETDDWWGWRHLTIHVLGALAALGGKTENRFAILEKLQPPGSVEEWLESFDWANNADFASNAVQNVGTMLQYARDFQGHSRADNAFKWMMDWLDEQQDPRTGLWGGRFDTPRLLSKGVQAAYHILLLYFYDQRSINFENNLIDSLLATQNRLGGFGTRKSSSACDDIDSIDPLVRFFHLSSYRRGDIELALNRALPWVLTNMNDDGGFVFFRGSSYTYGHDLMSSSMNQSAMFPTWFRTLSLAYINQCGHDLTTKNEIWQFINCPGYQFWNVA
jgi:hypothetical protein